LVVVHTSHADPPGGTQAARCLDTADWKWLCRNPAPAGASRDTHTHTRTHARTHARTHTHTLCVSLPEGNGIDGILQAEQQAARDAHAVALRDRTREQLNAGLGSILAAAVNMSCCTPALWGLLVRGFGLQGELESQREALLKQVRIRVGDLYKSIIN
jgi:hypothetical protein